MRLGRTAGEKDNIYDCGTDDLCSAPAEPMRSGAWHAMRAPVPGTSSTRRAELQHVLGWLLLCVLLEWQISPASALALHVNPVQKLLLGQYSNKRQADGDLIQGKPTAALGGHEWVTASIVCHPSLPTVLLAQYYFGTDKSKTFRFRCYEFVPTSASVQQPASQAYFMRLYRPLPATEAVLRLTQYDLEHPTVRQLPSLSPLGSASSAAASNSTGAGTVAPAITGASSSDTAVAAAAAVFAPTEFNQAPLAALLGDFEHLQGCDVRWAPTDPSAHATTPAARSPWDVLGAFGALQALLPGPPLPRPRPVSYRGVLVAGSCRVCSQADPTVQLEVRDDLGLYADRLEINDRVYTLDGLLVIGNSEGVPYIMDRA